jgi:hypothetical protein
VKASKLGLLVLILLSGGLIEAAWRGRSHLSVGPAGCRILTGRFQGPSFSFEAGERRDALPSPLSVRVENAFGSVSVSEGEADAAVLKVRKVVFLRDEGQARALAAELRASLVLEGSTLRVATNRREVEDRHAGEEVGFETHLSLSVPPGTEVVVQSEHGQVDVVGARAAEVSASFEPVRVERVAGSVSVKSRHGDVTLRGVQGALDVQARHASVSLSDAAGEARLVVEHGDVTVKSAAALDLDLRHGDLIAEGLSGRLAVRGQNAGVVARRVTGDVDVSTSKRDVRLEGIGAGVRARTEHGDVNAEDIEGPLSVEARYASVRAARVNGLVEAKVDHGGFRGDSLRGGVLVKSSGDEVVIEGYRGPVEVEARRGGVRLRPEAALVDSVIVIASYGGIRLALPAGSRGELEASAERGEVHVDLPDLVTSESSPSRVKGRIGLGGPSVRLQAKHGDVSVEAATGSLAERR